MRRRGFLGAVTALAPASVFGLKNIESKSEDGARYQKHCLLCHKDGKKEHHYTDAITSEIHVPIERFGPQNIGMFDGCLPIVTDPSIRKVVFKLSHNSGLIYVYKEV